MNFIKYLTVVACISTLINISSAEIIRDIDIDFVSIGNTGNPGDSSPDANPSCCGSVDFHYHIGKYEITNSQWNTFVLLAGLPTGNPIDAYEVSSHFFDSEQPVDNISRFEAFQFCNYLTSGDKSKGVYQFSGDNNNPGDFLGIDRDAAKAIYGKIYFMPTEDEWYKAAYHKPDNSGYSLYANGTSVVPIAGIEANYNYLPNNEPWDVGSGLIEQNNTYDMMGNVWELTETLFDSQCVIRGGSFSHNPPHLSRTFQGMLDSYRYAAWNVGFRVASISETVIFADANLQAAVEEELAKQGIYPPITKSDMLNLTSLKAQNRNMANIAGIEWAVNLGYLNIGDNQITDITRLSSLSNLHYLRLTNNPLGNIGSLSNLTTLQHLGLQGCSLNEISDIGNLSNLTFLNVGYNNISDISPIAGLLQLTHLRLMNNPIQDFSHLTNLLKLETLGVAQCGISDITFLENLTSLVSLNLANNQITAILPLAHLTNLVELLLPMNSVTDISPLENLPNLQHVTLYSNNIVDISPFANNDKLVKLWLHNNPLDKPAYCVYLPLIEEINTNIDLTYDSNPNASAGDCNGDCNVNLNDFAILASHWLEEGCDDCDGAEQTGDGNVFSDDLAVVVSNWLNKDFFKFDGNTLDSEPIWITQGQWEFGQPSGLGGADYGNPDPIGGFTGNNVFGVNLNGDYDASTPSGPYYLIAGPFNCTYLDNVKLKFARWLNSDEPMYVECTIDISVDGIEWTGIWKYRTRESITDSSWQLLEYDISSSADGQETVYIRWGYEVVDCAYSYSGWNIDDVELWGNCMPCQ